MVQIDTRWLDGSGYRPVRVRVTPLPPRPAPADRRVQVTVRPRGWRTGASRATVTGTVDLLQGNRFGETSLAVPHHEGWASIDVEVHEDGKLLPDLRANRLGIVRRSYYEWSEATPSVLFIDSDAPPWPDSSAARNVALPAATAEGTDSNRLPDLRGIAGRLPINHWNGVDESAFNTSKPIDDAQTLRLLRDWPRLEIVPPTDLPASWLELTSADLIVISREDLQLLTDEHAPQWAAVRSWLATGTTLCITGVNLAPDGLGELESLVGVPPLADAHGPLRGWWEPDPDRYADRLLGVGSDYQPGIGEIRVMPNRGRATALQQSAPQRTKDKPGKPAEPRPFVGRSCGAGVLVAIAAEHPFAKDPDGWCWLFNCLDRDKWMWYRRHGMSMFRENPDYWNLLIPGVGEAPVNSFLVLISLFVIVMGPVNYWMLQRHGRLYLLLVTVPAGALLVTVGLFAYALLTDGLAVRARVRSYTEIDQRLGRAVAWSRQTYYAGMAPAGGITFPADAAVYPVEFRPYSVLPTGRRWHTVWDGEQRLAEGFLPSRTTTQFLVVESRSSVSGLDVTRHQAGVSVVNRLGSKIRRLLVRSEQGKYYQALDVPARGSTLVPEVDLQEVAEPWNAWFAASLPQVPEGFDPYQMENVAEIFENGRYSWSGLDSSLSDPAFRTSIFERRWTAVVRQDFRLLGPRSYLAVVESSPEVSLGTAQAREQASLHVVVGRW